MDSDFHGDNGAAGFYNSFKDYYSNLKQEVENTEQYKRDDRFALLCVIGKL